MRVVFPPEPTETLLQRFQKIGGVVEYNLAALGSDEFASEDINMEWHRCAILLALERWNNAYKQHFAQTVQYVRTNQEYRRNFPLDTIAENEAEYARRAREGLTFTPDTLRGERITRQQFLGAEFILTLYPKRQTLSMRAELKRLSCDVDTEDEDEAAYAYAFSDPPYGLSGKPENKLELFRALNLTLFNDFAPGVEIYRWSTDWCDYFEAGQEWWGSFLWTVYNPMQCYIAVVSASATD